MLNLCDLNQIIRFYANSIQLRIEQLQNSNVYMSEEMENQQQYEFLTIISKYNNYQTKDQKEIKMVQKFRERVLQIFQFFKQKSNNQNLLNLIQNKIDKELHHFLTCNPLPLGQLFSYIHLTTKKGCIVRPPTNKRMRLFSKPIIKQPLKTASNYSVFNIKKKESSLVKNKFMNTSSAGQKLKVSEIVSQLWSVIDFDKTCLYKVKQGNQQLIQKDMLRRNDKIMAEIKKYSNRRNRLESQEFKESMILSQVKGNTFKRWSSKNKRIFVQRPKQSSTKENISVFI